MENLTYLAVPWSGWGADPGSLIISPQGEILAQEKRGGEIALAEIDPKGGRSVRGWGNSQDDMRARIFRERRPGAYGVLSDPHPPVMNDLPDTIPGPPEKIASIFERAITLGHEEYERAEQLLTDGKTVDAIAAYEALIRDYPATWFDHTAREKIAGIKASQR